MEDVLVFCSATSYRLKHLSREGASMPAQLRVYRSPEDSPRATLGAPTVRIRLSDLMPLISLAKRDNYLWLQDFLDDEVRITPDLYDVLQAFRAYRPSA
jgi:hypothetical protein